MPFGPGNPYRFKPGNPGSPGRPPKSTEDRILDAMVAHLPPEQLDAFAAKIVSQAIEGHNKAQRLLLEYLIGTPVQRSRLAVSDELADLLRNLRSDPVGSPGLAGGDDSQDAPSDDTAG